MTPRAGIPLLIFFVAAVSISGAKAVDERDGHRSESLFAQLSAHGTWESHPDFGEIWQPHVRQQNPGWRPYADDGHWLATAQGWYWHSDVPWGAVVFHYGRWGRDPIRGWYWVPDTMWGPSWVTFRMDADHLGWAPLPPRAIAMPDRGIVWGGRPVGTGFTFALKPASFTFVPLRKAFAGNSDSVRLSERDAERIFAGTTVINAIDIDKSLHVINRGVPIGYVRARAEQPTPFANIEISKSGGNSIVTRTVQGDEVVTVFRSPASTFTRYRPHIADTKPASRAASLSRNRVETLTAADRPPTPVRSAAEPVRPRPRIGYFVPRRSDPAAAGQPWATSRRPGNLSTPPPLAFTPAMPLTPPQPISSTPQLLGAPQPILSTPQILGPPRPVTFPPARSIVRTNRALPHLFPIAYP